MAALRSSPAPSFTDSRGWLVQPDFRPVSVLCDVVDSEYCGGCRYTGYINKTIHLTLACGHEMYRKASAGIPRKARCHECSRDATSDAIKAAREKFDAAR